MKIEDIKRSFSDVKINRIILFLTYGEVILLSGWSLINPILAIFFTEQIEGGTIKTAGLAYAVYFFTKSAIQIPYARLLDKWRGEKDDYISMMIGYVIISTVPFLYNIIRSPYHLYLVQFFYGIGGALAYPAWTAIFTRHIDKKHEGLEWSLFYTTTDLGAALSAGLGSYLVYDLGFKSIFNLIGTICLLGTALLLFIKSELCKTK